jgi:hypothetical protein
LTYRRKQLLALGGLALMTNLVSTGSLCYLESATKDLGTNILISEHIYYGAKGSIAFRNMGAITVPGREEPLTVYALEP